METALWTVQSELVAMFQTPLEALGAVVFDGQRIRGHTPEIYAVVGAGDTDPFDQPLADGEALDTFTGTARQGWASEGPGTWRQENGGVNCSLVAWSGDTDLAPLRTTVEGLVDACGTALRANRNAAGINGPGFELGELNVWERRSKLGAAVGVVFTVAYQALLT